MQETRIKGFYQIIKLVVVILFLGLAAGCSYFLAQGKISASNLTLPDLGQAAELTNEIWINSDQPLRLADVKGQVILLEMWSFGCVNCRNTLPSLREWHQTYRDHGLGIIGNHYWPTLYLSDKKGNLRYKHIGESAYSEIEAAFEALLAEDLH